MNTKKTQSLSFGPALGRISAALIAFIFLAGAAIYLPTRGLASDHRDSPTADATPEGDITDVFAFLDPNDPSRLVLIMNVNPFSVPAEMPSHFSPNLLYQFKIAHGQHAVEDLVVQAIFVDVSTRTCATGQMVKIYGPSRPQRTGATNVLLEEGPTAKGCTGQTLESGNVRVFAGLRDDPFVSDVGQLFRILTSKQDVFRDFPGFALGALRGRPVRSDHTSGVDGFGGFNLTSIAIELPKREVAGSGFLGKRGLIGVWGTTSRPINGDQMDPGSGGSFLQFQRAGQQLFKTIFVPSTLREAFNVSVPDNDMTNWSSLVPDALTTRDNDGTGNTIAGRAGLLGALGFTDASGSNAGAGHGAPLLLPTNFHNTSKDLLRNALLPDVLRLDLDLLPTGVLPGAAAAGGNGDPQLGVGAFGLQNGRRPADNVSDILVQLVRQLSDINFPHGLGVPGSGPPRPGALNFPADRRIFAVLDGTVWIKPDAQVGNVSGNVAPYGGNDRSLLAHFPFLAAPHPLPGEPGTVGFPRQH